MGEARLRKINGVESIGNDWKWLQRDYEERPVVFLERSQYIHPGLKRLKRLMKRTERKHEAANPKALLTVALLEDRFERLTNKHDRLVKRLNPLK